LLLGVAEPLIRRTALDAHRCELFADSSELFVQLDPPGLLVIERGLSRRQLLTRRRSRRLQFAKLLCTGLNPQLDFLCGRFVDGQFRVPLFNLGTQLRQLCLA